MKRHGWKEQRYRIEKEEPTPNELLIKAGKEWFDELGLREYESISLTLDVLGKRKKSLTFAVLSIEKGKGSDMFNLWLRSHDDPSLDVDGMLILHKRILSDWTGLSGRDIYYCFRNKVHLGPTFNLLAALPRKVVLTEDEVIISGVEHVLVKERKLCKLVLDKKYPIDLL